MYPIPYPDSRRQEKDRAVPAMNLVGFDSAWADNPKQPGAICALRTDAAGSTFLAPRLAGFDAALDLTRSLHQAGDLTLVAIDQPTIVANRTGMRPAERAVAGTIVWSGGGIQPAYRDKTAMFGDGAPIWRFLAGLGFADDPEAAARADTGGFVMEVYPALALLSLDETFAAAKRRPRYNPAVKSYRPADWRAVRAATETEARRLGLAEPAAWCAALDRDTKPRKSDQDRLDALLCLLIAARWRRDRDSCAMIGDLANGYIVAPVSSSVRARLETAAAARGVPIA
jgi:predicted RNase H-like nuclease